jgi:hypothetical protein
VLKAEGQAATLSRRSRVDKDGGSEPNWSGEVLYMDIVDQYMLKIDCLNHDLLGKDELIGCADLRCAAALRCIHTALSANKQ